MLTTIHNKATSKSYKVYYIANEPVLSMLTLHLNALVLRDTFIYIPLFRGVAIVSLWFPLIRPHKVIHVKNLGGEINY